MSEALEKCDVLLKTIRKIIRAIDLHSKQLMRKYGLTGPQMLVLKAIYSAKDEAIHSSQLADCVSLSLATVTSILDRLAERAYIKRIKSEADRRKTFIILTDKAYNIMQAEPTLLQDEFIDQFGKLKDWEQSLLVSSCERIAEMMQAKSIDAAPLLVSGDLIKSEEH